MAYNENWAGSLGRNQKKDQQAAGAPDYRGKLNIDGKLHYLSAWIKTNGQTGEKFFSISAEPANPEQSAPATAPAAAPVPADSDIPF